MKLCLSNLSQCESVFEKRREGEKTLAIKLEFTIRSEMRSRSGRGAKLFKTNVYLEKWALSMGLPVLPECRTNVFTRPGQSRPPAGLHADLCIIQWPFSEDNIPQKETKYGEDKVDPCCEWAVFWLKSGWSNVNLQRKIYHSLDTDEGGRTHRNTSGK